MAKSDPYDPETLPNLTPDDFHQLCRWRDAQEADQDPKLAGLMRAGYLHNLERLANAYGGKLVAMLVREGYLKPGEDPIAVLGLVLWKAEMFDDCSNGGPEDEEDPDDVLWDPQAVVARSTPTARVMGCIRCAKPSALVGDLLPEDQLCPWCRGSVTPGAPGVSALWCDDRRATAAAPESPEDPHDPT
jgi:hypothetical protein